MMGAVCGSRRWHTTVFYLGMVVAVSIFMAGCPSDDDADDADTPDWHERSET
jgi:hypothetical protein